MAFESTLVGPKVRVDATVGCSWLVDSETEEFAQFPMRKVASYGLMLAALGASGRNIFVCDIQGKSWPVIQFSFADAADYIAWVPGDPPRLFGRTISGRRAGFYVLVYPDGRWAGHFNQMSAKDLLGGTAMVAESLQQVFALFPTLYWEEKYRMMFFQPKQGREHVRGGACIWDATLREGDEYACVGVDRYSQYRYVWVLTKAGHYREFRQGLEAQFNTPPGFVPTDVRRMLDNNYLVMYKCEKDDREVQYVAFDRRGHALGSVSARVPPEHRLCFGDVSLSEYERILSALRRGCVG